MLKRWLSPIAFGKIIESGVNQVSTFYFSVGIISRGKGQSAVASASYRSGEKLYSVLDDETKYYGKRTVQPETFILAPEHAPEWVYDRQRLWNEVELVERHVKAQLAREIKLALPIELPHDVQRKLLEEYVQENFVNRGMVADVAIHRDVKHNPHAHIMLTLRPFNKDGSWGNKKKKEYLLDENGNKILDKNGKPKYKTIPLTDWNEKKTLIEWRKNLAEKINEYYKFHGINERVSHESYEAQSLDKLPKFRLSREEYFIEKRAKEQAEKEGKEYTPITKFGQLNYEIEKANKELENINNKIVSLEEYKKTIEGDLYKELITIRKNFALSKEDWDSLKVVAKRVSGFVDLQNAYDNLQRLDRWKLNIDRQRNSLVAKGKIIEIAKLAYKENPKNALLYGFIPNKLDEQLQIKREEYNNEIDKFNNTIKAFNDLYRHSKRAYEIQKSFINEEFRFLYPDYAEDMKGFNNDKAMELKNKYVDLFKKEKVLRFEIPELENHLDRYSNDYVDMENAYKDWKEVNNSLLILERTKRKYEKEYALVFKDWKADEVFDKQVRLMEVRNQISYKEEFKNEVANKMTDILLKQYPAQSKEMIESIPNSVKASLLNLHLEGKQTGDLTNDLQAVQKEHDNIRLSGEEKAKLDKMLDDKYANEKDNKFEQNAGDLFSLLIANAQKDEGKGDDLERRRKRSRFKHEHAKLRKRIRQKLEKGELEL